MRSNVKYAWAGLYGGALLWYIAHDLSVYVTNHDCKYLWVAPLIHIIAFIGTIFCGLLSYRANADDNGKNLLGFSSLIGTAAAGLFALVIVYQGIAIIVFRSCVR